MSGLALSLIVVEAMLTALGLAAFVYRARLQFKEENTMVLNAAEAHLVEGQDLIRARVRQLDSLIRYVGIGWLVFGVAALVVWLGQGAGLI